MILSDYVLSPSNKKIIKFTDLAKSSRAIVECLCDHCGVKFSRKYRTLLKNINRDHLCKSCTEVEKAKHIDWSNLKKVNSERLKGSKNPKWNPNRSEFQKYAYKVRRLTEENYKKHKDELNPYNFPRRLCGVEGGWQLDHILSIKEGFVQGKTPEFLSDIKNLQMLPWENNLLKSYK